MKQKRIPLVTYYIMTVSGHDIILGWKYLEAANEKR